LSFGDSFAALPMLQTANLRRTTMRSSFKSTLVLTTALAIALTGLDLRPAAATPESGPAVAKQNAAALEFGAARKRRRGRGVNPAIPLAAFGAIVGTIGSIAAAQRRRDYYERYYDGPYDGPYHGGYAYHQPYVHQPYVHQHYAPPAPVHRQYGLGGRPYDYGPRGYLGPGAHPQLGNPTGSDSTPP
jgi:hypothetical protein